MAKKGTSRTNLWLHRSDGVYARLGGASPEWTYELKLDGYRLEVVQTQKETTLYSRRRNILDEKFPYIATALKSLPEGTVIDGVLVADKMRARLVEITPITNKQVGLFDSQ